MNEKNELKKDLDVFALFFLLTGIFAIVGSLFTWGDGWLFSQSDLLKSLIPLADLIVTGPISIISAFGIWNQKRWGIYLAMMCSGIYIFGSALVYIMLVWKGSPYPPELFIPPLFGMVFSTLFFVKVLESDKNPDTTLS